MIKLDQLIDHVIIPTIRELDLDKGRLDLPCSQLVVTSAIESNLGSYLKQVPNGPALSIYQMEPATYCDIWENWLKYRPDIRMRVLSICGYASVPDESRLVTDLKLATIMARLHYYRVKKPLPTSIEEQIEYYYQYWGPNKEKTTLDEAKRRYFEVMRKERLL